jgi:hypothetical protein
VACLDQDDVAGMTPGSPGRVTSMLIAVESVVGEFSESSSGCLAPRQDAVAARERWRRLTAELRAGHPDPATGPSSGPILP